jgi:DNA-binding CsgD family transcriptional regulator
MPSAVAGRDAELAALQDFLAGISEGTCALLLEGEAGVGKTTLWNAGVSDARSAGHLVLRTRPAESETSLSFTGVSDLLDPVLEVALEPLPGAQRTALARALVLEDSEGAQPDPHAVGVAFLNVLRAFAESRPVLVAVDDVQWLDAASAAGLAYAARRLEREPVGMLLARRTSLESKLVADVRRSLPAERFVEVPLGPLDADALDRVVRDHLEVVLARPLLVEVHAAAGGNPLFALEIVRTLRQRAITVEAGKPLPVPDSLQELVHGRIRALPEASRLFLLAAAAHANPRATVVAAASGVSPADGLTPALEARVVELEGDRIQFTHPLFAAGAYETADVGRRRDVHARLAELLEDPEARAWQRAAATELPDEVVAAELELAAEHLRARGARRAAALLLERSIALTPDGEDDGSRRRIVQAAYDHHAAGDTERARSLLEPVLERTPAGLERASLLVALARLRSYDDDVRGASALYREAVADAPDASLVEAYAQEGLAGTLFRLREKLAEAVEMSGAAAETARGHEAIQLEAEALATKAVSAAALGLADAAVVADAALALQHACLDRPALRQPVFAAMCVRFWHDDLDGAFDVYEGLAAAARELGDESSLPYTCVMIGQIECARGRFGEAREVAETGRRIAEQAGQRALVAYSLAVRALAEAHLGDVAEARSSSDRALELAEATSGIPAWIFATWAAGHTELACGDPARAVEILTPLVVHHEREDIREPGALPFLPDTIEAQLESGRVDEAESLLDGYRATAAKLGRARGVAAARRLTGLALSARRAAEEAVSELEAAVELSSGLPTPFERARALLALGVALRRAKRRREARATLEEAQAVFEGMGAAVWAERAREELKRISGRAASPGALTPAEERIAGLVAEGKTNREVAAALYLSERTVEGHLSHVFGKLGVRSRTELAHALATRQQGVASPNPGDSPVSTETLAP